MYDPLEIFVVQPPNIEQNHVDVTHERHPYTDFTNVRHPFLIIRPIFNIFYFLSLTLIMMVMLGVLCYSAKYITYMQY